MAHKELVSKILSIDDVNSKGVDFSIHYSYGNDFDIVNEKLL
jgi:hypothetical protein